MKGLVKDILIGVAIVAAVLLVVLVVVLVVVQIARFLNPILTTPAAEAEKAAEAKATKIIVKEVVVTATLVAEKAAEVAEAPSSDLDNTLPGDPFPLWEEPQVVPDNGTTWFLDVAPDQIEVLTGGPMSVAGIKLSGGETRGSVLVFLPDPARVTKYDVAALIPGSNWFATYGPIQDPLKESGWKALAESRAQAMTQEPNCTSGRGCDEVDVLVVGPGPKTIAQWQVQRGGQNQEGQKEGVVDLVTPTVTPEAAVQPTPGAALVINISAGEIKEISAEYVVSGDVEVSPSQDGPWTKLYDNDATTGLVVKFDQTGWVKAPWGASAALISVDKAKAQLLAAGCGSSCEKVTVMNYPQ